MLTALQVRDSIQEGQALKQLAEIYTELSVQKLQKIRQRIESNRGFVGDLAQVFHIVREAAVRQGIQVVKKKGTLSILITSNHPFYGNIETQLVRFFMAHSSLNYGDLMIIGSTGINYLKGVNFTSPYTPFTFHDDMPTFSELSQIAVPLIAYEKVLVYHAKFQTVIIQRPVVTEISGFINANPGKDTNFYYILEPETAKMLEFFDTQIAKLLLEQAFLEAELARTGARLILMNDSQRKADKLIIDQSKLLVTVNRARKNAQMLEMTLGTLSRKHKYA